MDDQALLSFGLWIKRRRKALDLTQDGLAALVGCSKDLIVKIEGDARRPSREIAGLLATQLQLAPEERDAFIRCARAELAPDRLPPPARSAPRAAFVPASATSAPAPSGSASMVLFLFTDIVGSTRLWEQHPDAMRAALARHDSILRQAIGEAGGQVFKTVGDAFCAAFSLPHQGSWPALPSSRRSRLRTGQRTDCPSRFRCAWHCTPARPSGATATTLGHRSTGLRGCWQPGTAARCCFLRPRRRCWPTSCQRTLSWLT